MKLQDCINFQLTTVQSSVFSYFKSVLAKYDVTPSQYALLSCLWEKDGQPVSQLAQAMCLDPSSMSGLLTRAEAKGLISRQFSLEDRRTVMVHLSDLGRSLQAGITQTIEEANAHTLRGFSAEERDVLRQCLNKLTMNTR